MTPTGAGPAPFTADVPAPPMAAGPAPPMAKVPASPVVPVLAPLAQPSDVDAHTEGPSTPTTDSSAGDGQAAVSGPIGGDRAVMAQSAAPTTDNASAQQPCLVYSFEFNPIAPEAVTVELSTPLIPTTYVRFPIQSTRIVPHVCWLTFTFCRRTSRPLRPSLGAARFAPMHAARARVPNCLCRTSSSGKNRSSPSSASSAARTRPKRFASATSPHPQARPCRQRRCRCSSGRRNGGLLDGSHLCRILPVSRRSDS